jgi:hypothetical protein
MIGGRKVRSNKGKKRGSYGHRTGKTRSGKRFRTVTKSRKVGRKTRSNKGKKRTPYGPRTGKTRSGKKFRGGDNGDKYDDEFKGFNTMFNNSKFCSKYTKMDECQNQCIPHSKVEVGKGLTACQWTPSADSIKAKKGEGECKSVTEDSKLSGFANFNNVKKPRLCEININK